MASPPTAPPPNAGGSGPLTAAPPPAFPPASATLPVQLHVSLAGEPHAVYVIRRRDLDHVPATPDYSLDAYRQQFVLLLCPAYARSRGHCPKGAACPLAHAAVRPSTRRFTPHFAWGPPPGSASNSSPDASTAAPSPRQQATPSAQRRYPAHLPPVLVGTPDGVKYLTLRPQDCYVTQAHVTPSLEGGGDIGQGATAAVPPSVCVHWLSKGVPLRC
jgi:hypothetical protein